jgi:hypothetical protein
MGGAGLGTRSLLQTDGIPVVLFVPSVTILESARGDKQTIVPPKCVHGPPTAAPGSPRPSLLDLRQG